MSNFKPFRRIVIIACVIYQMLVSMIGGGALFGPILRWFKPMGEEMSFIASCFQQILTVFVLVFPMVWGFIVLIAFDEKRKQPVSKKNAPKQGVNGKQRIVRLVWVWPQIIKFEEIECDSDEGGESDA